LSSKEPHAREAIPQGQLALTGPSRKFAEDHMPVRGDLAHVRLAGVCFVPHYAVPMPHRVANGGAVLRGTASAEGEVLCSIDAGATFDVLDIAGGWCWGELGEGGFVGYVEQAALEELSP
jgi:hypothetical protein